MKGNKNTLQPSVQTNVAPLPISPQKAKDCKKANEDKIVMRTPSKSNDDLIEKLPIAPARGISLTQLTLGPRLNEKYTVDSITQQSETETREPHLTQDLEDILKENEKQSEVLAALHSQPTPQKSVADSNEGIQENEVALEKGGNLKNKSDDDVIDDEVSSEV